MARDRSTPASAQLRRWLADREGSHETFSALTLAAEFEAPRSQTKKTKLATINKALRKAFGDAEIVAYVDERGLVLRETGFGAPGSAALEHPTIFGLPGTPPPSNGYRSATAVEVGRQADDNHSVETDQSSEAHGSELPGAVEATEASDTSTDNDGEDDRLNQSQLTERLRDWCAVSPAPQWLDPLLREYVRLPTVHQMWRDWLTKSPRQRDRIPLIRAGVRRKGDLTAASATMLAELCCTDVEWWDRCARAAIQSYAQSEGSIPSEDLPELCVDPIGYADRHPSPGAYVVLIGLMLGADAGDLELLADDVDSHGSSDEESGSVEDRLRDRVDALQRENDLLERVARTAEAERDQERGNAEALRESLERFHIDQARDGDEAQRDAANRERLLEEAQGKVARLEAELRETASADEGLETLDAEAARLRDDLEEEAAELARTRESLEARRNELEEERRRRATAERQVQDQLANVRHLNQRLAAAERSATSLPSLEDASSLLDALAPPIGQAAALAAQRLASGRTAPGDHRLLELAGVYGRLTADDSALTTSGASLGQGEDSHPSFERERVALEAEPETVETSAAEETAQPEGLVPSTTESGHLTPDEETTSVETPTDAPNGVESSEEQPGGNLRTAPGVAAARRSPFTVRAMGGAEEVGGSAILVETRSGTVLLDAGQRVRGEYGDDDAGQFHYADPDVRRLDAILVSHAHVDHVGSLPLLVQEHARFQDDVRPAVWMSEPTRDLSKLMLSDSAKIQHARGRLLEDLADSDMAQEAIKRIAYDQPDVDDVMGAVETVSPGHPKQIPGTQMMAKFIPVPHVLGSCAIHLKDLQTGATLLYTGDLGPYSDPQLTLPAWNPGSVDAADVVIMESTYGKEREVEREGRKAPSSREAAVKTLRKTAEHAFEQDGFVLLPAFSLGRTQELIRLIGSDRDMPNRPIYVGGMGDKITNIYTTWGNRRDERWAEPARFPSVDRINNWVRRFDGFGEAAEAFLEESEPGYLVVSPAMLSGGWSRAFLEAMVEDARHAVLLTGWMPRHAGGIRNFEQLGKNRPLTLPGENAARTVRCEWVQLKGLSAHAPARDLHRFASEISRGRDVAFGLVHGERPAQVELANWISDSLGKPAASLQRNVNWVPGR